MVTVQKTRASMAYILEVLGMEHDRAFMSYVPRPYSGDVLLFRASKQLPGMLADRSLGWKPIIKGHLEIRELPGHQQNILVEPQSDATGGRATVPASSSYRGSGQRNGHGARTRAC